MKSVIVQITPEFHAFAAERAAENGFIDAADYLNAVLNTALLSLWDREGWPRPGGDDGNEAPDLKDGIPF